MAKGNVGNRIRVVDADAYSDYVSGDEGVIVQADEECSGADIRFDKNGDSHYLYGHEYEILHETSSATEEAIPWAVGQEVFCLLRGKGVVTEFDSDDKVYPVCVDFETGSTHWYTSEGKEESNYNRSLFFSDPQIIADKLPPKKPFVPTLKKGDVVFAEYPDKVFKIVVEQEDEDSIVSSQGVGFTKKGCVFYKVDNAVEFSIK